jgi:nicotinate-nucleotide adenylyltransferase
MKIGICGGTFDPIHRGHLDPVLAVRERVGWDRILYVPAFKQPFKSHRDAVSGFHRFAMVAMATTHDDALFACDWELQRGRVSYTVDTLEQLRGDHPDATLDWVIGDDNLEKLLDWKSIERIFELANFVVLSRGEHRLPEALASRVVEPEARGLHGGIAFAANATIPISSTDIRRRVRDGEPIDHLVPPPVSRYIHHYGLYRKGQS